MLMMRSEGHLRKMKREDEMRWKKGRFARKLILKV
jgi:hypothetical protein